MPPPFRDQIAPYQTRSISLKSFAALWALTASYPPITLRGGFVNLELCDCMCACCRWDPLRQIVTKWIYKYQPSSPPRSCWFVEARRISTNDGFFFHFNVFTSPLRFNCKAFQMKSVRGRPDHHVQLPSKVNCKLRVLGLVQELCVIEISLIFSYQESPSLYDIRS